MVSGVIRMIDVKCGRARRRAPRTLQALLMWIGTDCNLSCRMCGEAYRSERLQGNRTLGLDHWLAVIDSAKRLGCLVVSVTGGEPLLCPDLFRILEGIKHAGMATHLCTNGCLVSEDVIDQLAATSVRSVSVSLDSHIAATHNYLRNSDSFDTTIGAIRLLRSKRSDINVTVGTVLCRPNITHLSGVVNLAAELGVSKVNLAPLHSNLQHKHKPPASFDELLVPTEELAELETNLRAARAVAAARKVRLSSPPFLNGIVRSFREEQRWHVCYAGYASCSVSAWGDVAPCCDMDSNLNVTATPLHEIWRSRQFQSLRDRVDTCAARCWDTTHAELSLRCSLRGMLRCAPAMLQDYCMYRPERTVRKRVTATSAQRDPVMPLRDWQEDGVA